MSFMNAFERGMEKILVPVAIKLNSQIHIYFILPNRDGQFADYLN